MNLAMHQTLELLKAKQQPKLVDLFNGEGRRKQIELKAEFQQLSTVVMNQCFEANANGRTFHPVESDDILKVDFTYNGLTYNRKYYANCELSHRRLKHFIKWMEKLNFLGAVA